MNHLFVYGTLMQGMGNHGYLSSSRLVLREAFTCEWFVMVDLGGFPGIVRETRTSYSAEPILGELYAVDDQTLCVLDRLEGHPFFYQRREIGVESGFVEYGCWAYVLSRTPVPLIRVSPADWRTYWTAKQTTEA